MLPSVFMPSGASHGIHLGPIPDCSQSSNPNPNLNLLEELATFMKKAGMIKEDEMGGNAI